MKHVSKSVEPHTIAKFDVRDCSDVDIVPHLDLTHPVDVRYRRCIIDAVDA